MYASAYNREGSVGIFNLAGPGMTLWAFDTYRKFILLRFEVWNCLEFFMFKIKGVSIVWGQGAIGLSALDMLLPL